MILNSECKRYFISQNVSEMFCKNVDVLKTNTDNLLLHYAESK